MSAVPDIDRADGNVTATTTHQLYQRYGGQIHAYCLHQLRSREEAEDAVQTTFLNAFRGLQGGTVPRAEQAWLYKIAQNVCAERRSSSARRLRLETPNNFEVLQEIVPAQPRESAVELIGLEDALESMPENQRRAILLREWQGLSYREIGAELRLSQASVEMLIFRARRTLAGALEQPAEPKKLRHKVGRSLNLGSILTAVKSLLTGGAAVKAVALAVAVGTVSVTASAVEHTIVRSHSSVSAPAASPVEPSSVGAVPAPAKAAPESSSQRHAPAHVASLGEQRLRTGGRGGASARPALDEPPTMTTAGVPTPAPAVVSEPAPPAAPVQAPAATPPAPQGENVGTKSRDDRTPSSAQETTTTSPGDDGNAKKEQDDSTPTTTTSAPPPTPVDQGNGKDKKGDNGNGKSNGNGKNDPVPVQSPVVAVPTVTIDPAAMPSVAKGDNGNGKSNGNGRNDPVPVQSPVVAVPTVTIDPAAMPSVAPPALPAADNGNGKSKGHGNGK